MLVQRTNNVEKEFCYYVKEGKLSAVTDLLLVAPEKFLPSSVNNQEFDSDRSINVREFVLDEVASMTILNMINTHVEATLESVMKLQVKKLEMEAMLQLIEVFERMGETLAAYLRMQQPVLFTLIFESLPSDYLRMRALTRKRKYYLGSTGQIPGVSNLQSCHLTMSGCSSPRKGGTNMMRQLMEVEYAVPIHCQMGCAIRNFCLCFHMVIVYLLFQIRNLPMEIIVQIPTGILKLGHC